MTPEIESKVRFHLGVHRAWDASDYYKRDAQHDAAGFEFPLCPECDAQLPDDYCPECRVFAADPNDTDDILAGDFNLVGDHGINEVW